MNKQEFLAELKAKLTGMSQEDIEGQIGFYSEIIDDRMEEGLTEKDAVAELGSLEDITMQIMSEIPLTKFVKEKVKPSRALRAWEVVLLVLGAPIWLPLLIALFAIVISIYAVIWSIIISLWAIEFSLVACSVAGAFSSVVFMVKGSIVPGAAMLGAGITCVGIAILGFYGCKYATNAIFKFSKRIFIWIKSCFMKKEATE
ncbi:MAG: DUF1700 domain-containing protein [Lachnospiraceae bacterium]|jgi:uncharacterized membrane protein|nr:DUF1700 domain-containing protein [Lachnospiraceae bacterium]